ncbi:MAG TPA: MBOAT family O-acyltransferase [Bacteroidia bacterium]|nr:MBOAT family O-acyltransferase [Bacteroidia bacterium]
MVFASLVFLYIFLPLNLILYYALKDSVYRNALLTIFSLFFYAWGEPVWVFLLIFTSLVDYANALFIEKYRDTKWAKAGLVSSVIFNLGILMVFKYSGFFVQNLNFITGLSIPVPAFTLPIGISFYTFQSVSYVVDVYRREVPAQRDYMKFLMFVSLYHQLVAGPIVRYVHIANEIDSRKFNLKDISAGVTRFCIGLFKKVCIANVAGQFVATYLDGDLTKITGAEAWFGILMYTFQIYFDFSGYSDMAIGLGRMFGFHYYENFNYPYIANTATEFWRRWHISLSTWFRDYIYIPLGGKYKFQVRNLFIVWFLTGFWHGASWNFILWGLYWGTLIFLERMFLFKVLEKLPKFIWHLYLLFAVVIGWTLFYFTDFERLGQFMNILFGLAPNTFWTMPLQVVLKENMFWIAITVILCTPVYRFINWWTKDFLGRRKWHLLWYGTIAINVVLLLLSTAMLVEKSYNPFIYYRF